MDNREQIKRYIKAYLLGAKGMLPILLTGEWGVGKTYLVREEIISELKKEGECVLYVSLNGVNSIEELERKIVGSFLGSNGNLLLTIGRHAGGILAGLSSNKILKQTVEPVNNLLKKYSIEKAKSLAFVFDDIERCSLAVKEWSGYLDTLIEHNKCPVVFIGNEERICDLNEYQRIKEKIIGQTFVLQMSFECSKEWLLDDVMNAIGKSVIDDVNSFTSKLCEIGDWGREEFKVGNLRALRNSIFNLTVQLDTYGDILKRNQKRCVNFSLAFVLLSYCVQLNKLSRKSWKLESKKNTLLRGVNKSQESCGKDVYYTSVLDRCPVLDRSLWREGWESCYLLTSNVWERLIFGEGVSEEELKERFEDVSFQEWQHLYYFRSLTTEEVEKGLEKLKKQCAACDFSSINEIRMVYGTIEYIKKCQYDVLKKISKGGVEDWNKQQECILEQYQGCADKYYEKNEDTSFMSVEFDDVYQGYQIPNAAIEESLYGRMRDYVKRLQDRRKDDYIKCTIGSNNLVQITNLFLDQRFNKQSIVTDGAESHLCVALVGAKSSDYSAFLMALDERYHIVYSDGNECLAPYISELSGWKLVVVGLKKRMEKILMTSPVDYMKALAIETIVEKIQTGVIARIEERSRYSSGFGGEIPSCDCVEISDGRVK